MKWLSKNSINQGCLTYIDYETLIGTETPYRAQKLVSPSLPQYISIRLLLFLIWRNFSKFVNDNLTYTNDYLKINKVQTMSRCVFGSSE